MQFANHAELQAHFSGLYLENLSNSKEMIKYIQCKVKKLEGKISGLVTKLNKHSERLAIGNLPAKWNLPLQIEEDIGKERTKLHELQAELCEIKLQASNIQHLSDDGSEGEMDSNVEDDEEYDQEGILGDGNLSLGLGEV